MKKNFLLFLFISLSLGISQAYSQNTRYLTPRSVDWAVEKEFHCDSIRAGEYLFMPERVADTIHDLQDSIEALRSDIVTLPISGNYYAIDNIDGTVTGTISETILCSVPIISGDVGPNDVIKIEAFMYAVGTSGTKSYKVYFGPNNNSLVSAIQIGAFNFIASHLSGEFIRKIVNKGSTSSNVCYPVTQPAGDPYTAFAGARVSTNINFSNTQYLMITCTLQAVADVGGLSDVELYIFKPWQ